MVPEQGEEVVINYSEVAFCKERGSPFQKVGGRQEAAEIGVRVVSSNVDFIISLKKMRFTVLIQLT